MLKLSSKRKNIVKSRHEPIISERVSGLVQSVLVIFKGLQSAGLVMMQNVGESKAERLMVNFSDLIFQNLGSESCKKKEQT